MKKICLQEIQVSNMMDALVGNLLPKENPNPYVDKEEVLSLLRCSSGTLQKLRDEDKIEFHSITSKLIIYNYSSIVQFIKSKSNLI
ncbi:MAG: hypothetical protein HRT61_11260 [Ekhidna sp.]|nr:hypothetical protein [Ekhidna sp.]